jgi:uncharacterized protein (TIGR02611 family)
MILLRKCPVPVLGGALLIAGLAMLVLPGPAVVVIPAALAILAVEFLRARRWLAWLRKRYKTVFSNRPAPFPYFKNQQA